MLSEAGYKEKHEEGLKILTSKQIHQRLPIALAQIKEGNTSENLLTKWNPRNIYFLYQGKDVTKKVDNNILNSIKVQYKMDTIYL